MTTTSSNSDDIWYSKLSLRRARARSIKRFWGRFLTSTDGLLSSWTASNSASHSEMSSCRISCLILFALTTSCRLNPVSSAPTAFRTCSAFFNNSELGSSPRFRNNDGAIKSAIFESSLLILLNTFSFIAVHCR
ncbi:unnamed protein product [Haemonchus placei]|uniref:Secreted protein n=1 Tax=Haemonchus placei TaxID=6290 RepID=A0A0N4WZ38_HAEPC|nr:unnamed protein product [Haemonchus placei]